MAKKKKYPIGKCPRAKVSASNEEFEIPSDVFTQLAKNQKEKPSNYYEGRQT
jgi:hypothetical protein